MYSLGLGVLGFWVLRLSAFGFRALASLGFRVQGVVLLGFLGFKVSVQLCTVQGSWVSVSGSGRSRAKDSWV